MKLAAKTGGCPNAKCGSQECGHTAPSSEWRCRCRRLWIKCPIHVHVVERTSKVSRSDQPAKKHRQELGANAPMPKRRSSAAKRCIQTYEISVSEANLEYNRMRFPFLSSCLADRFHRPKVLVVGLKGTVVSGELRGGTTSSEFARSAKRTPVQHWYNFS